VTVLASIFFIVPNLELIVRIEGFITLKLISELILSGYAIRKLAVVYNRYKVLYYVNIVIIVLLNISILLLLGLKKNPDLELQMSLEQIMQCIIVLFAVLNFFYYQYRKHIIVISKYEIYSKGTSILYEDVKSTKFHYSNDGDSISVVMKDGRKITLDL